MVNAEGEGSMDMKNVALIFAGGVGQRMGGQIP